MSYLIIYGLELSDENRMLLTESIFLVFDVIFVYPLIKVTLSF